MSNEEDEFAKSKKECDEAIAKLRASDVGFDMAYKLGSLQAHASFAVKYLRMGAENCKNIHIRAMLRKEASSLRNFLVNECKMDIPFDSRYDV
jgi:hypothetical protein